MTPEQRQLAERAVGIVTTFVLFRTVSKFATGISFPGTVVAIAATAGAAMCSNQSGGPVCTAQTLANWPGNQVGRLTLNATTKLMERRLLEGRVG